MTVLLEYQSLFSSLYLSMGELELAENFKFPQSESNSVIGRSWEDFRDDCESDFCPKTNAMNAWWNKDIFLT